MTVKIIFKDKLSIIYRNKLNDVRDIETKTIEQLANSLILEQVKEQMAPLS